MLILGFHKVTAILDDVTISPTDGAAAAEPFETDTLSPSGISTNFY